ncbi:glycosyltransferase family 9 protein [Herbiconiux sp. L3-i23]|uniref:glycosyltransferase family 9 protein n=1 Tax=Herbiconiux sp. L3-i23 TaxID=2905871 RepID=UPI002072D6E6|nr:glycosyltransferase family 9 protein [Herbiconiux sp. L3-i23]
MLPRWDFDDTPLRYLASASRARSVVGFAPVAEREPIWLGEQTRLLTDVIARGDSPMLSVEQLRRVAEHLGVPWLPRPDPAVGYALFNASDRGKADRAAELSTRSDLIVGVGIGARDAKRQWPTEELVQTLTELSRSRSLAVQVLGGDVDIGRAGALVTRLADQGVHAANLAGRLTLSESAAAISRCQLFLGNDSGLQHIASSLDVATIVVTCHPANGSPWSDNAPERFGPWSRRSVVLQPPHPAEGCTDECTASEPHCIRAVHAVEAVAAAEHLLELGRE